MDYLIRAEAPDQSQFANILVAEDDIANAYETFERRVNETGVEVRIRVYALVPTIGADPVRLYPILSPNGTVVRWRNEYGFQYFESRATLSTTPA
jgi:hypothetical protein